MEKKKCALDLREMNQKIGLINLNMKSYCIFVPVKKIEEVENRLISDITVKSTNHSFIAGDGFMSSNSSMCKQSLGIYALNFAKRNRYGCTCALLPTEIFSFDCRIKSI